MIKSITKDNKTWNLNQQFWTYPMGKGGFYIFSPNSEGNPTQMESHSFTIFSGDIVQVAEAVWKTKNTENDFSTFSQKVVLFDSSRLKVDIKVFALSGEEILVRFTNPDIKDNPFLFTGNSADIRVRKFEPFDKTTMGKNFYPIPGGMAAKADDCYLKVFGEFSVGVGMT